MYVTLCLLSSRVEKRKVPDPVGVLKEKFLRPPPLLFHPQVRPRLRAGSGLVWSFEATRGRATPAAAWASPPAQGSPCRFHASP